MPIYINTKGTTNNCFQIGSRGVTISTSTITDSKTSETLKNLIVDGSIVLTENNSKLFIPQSICSSIEEDDEKFTFTIKTFDKNKREWVISKAVFLQKSLFEENSKYVSVNGIVNSGRVPVFSDNTGKVISDSGFSITESISELGDRKTLPTTGAIIDFLKETAIPLLDRMNGE